MTVVNLTALETLLEQAGPITRGEVTATYWAGRKPFVNVAGAAVTFPAPIVVSIIDGAPSAALDMAPTGDVSCVKWEVRSFGGGRAPEPRYTSIPATGPIDFGDLERVDPATLTPMDPTPPTAQEILAEAATALGAAAASEAARDEAVAAKTEAEDIVASVIPTTDAALVAVLGDPTSQAAILQNSTIAGVLSEDETVVAAASAAAETAIDGLDVLVTSEREVEDEVAWAIIFDNLHQTFMEMRGDGTPSTWAAHAIQSRLRAARPVALGLTPATAEGGPNPFMRNPIDVPIFAFAGQAAASIYWPWIVDRWIGNPDIDASERWALYYSTDHAVLHSGSGIYLATAATPFGPYTPRGRVYRDDTGGSQSETGAVIWNEYVSLWYMYYQQKDAVDANGIGQMTVLATSPDGVNWTRVGTVLQRPSETMTAVSHCGYFRPFRWAGGWYGYSLFGTGRFAFWTSKDGLTWTMDPRPMTLGKEVIDQIVGYTPGSEWAIKWNSGNVIDWRGRPWLITTAGPITGGGTLSSNRSIAVPLAASLRDPAGRAIDITPPAQPGEGDVDGGGNVFTDGRSLFSPFRTHGATGEFRLREIV